MNLPRRVTTCAGVLLALSWLGGCSASPASPDPVARLSVAQRDDAARQLVVTIDDARAPRLAATPGATPRMLGGASGYRGSSRAEALVRGLARDHGLAWLAGWRIDPLGVHCVVFEVPAGASRDAALAALRADPRVESAQPMQAFATSASSAAEPVPVPSAVPHGAARNWDDPYYPLQHALPAMRVPEAQRLATGRAVQVAVIDTGVDTTHPDLAPRIQHAANFVDADAARFRGERHGTAVAGAIAATGDNRLGIVGVAPEVRLSVLKACWQDTAALPGTCNTLTLAEAISYAIERRVQVINLSLTGPADPLLDRLLRRAVDEGIVVLAADPRRDDIAPSPFPVGIPGVIGIRDADTQAAAGATLAAPGRAVLTTVPGGHYDYVSGTSMSVALASGIVALALQVDPATDGANLDRVLRSSARVATPAPTLLDAERTVRELAAAKRRAGSRSGAAPSRTTAGTRSTQRSRRITTPSSSSALIAGSPSRLR